MSDQIKFVCKSDKNKIDYIPSEIINKLDISFPDVHRKGDDIVKLSTEIGNYLDDEINILPFCNTVLSESMGGIIKLGDNKIGPRIDKYKYRDIKGLESIEEIDLLSGRIKEVLDATSNLAKQDKLVCLNIEGVFTVISSLIEPLTLYKAIRKNKETVEKVIGLIEENIIIYAKKAIEKGVDIISFGDPVGAMDIVGPKVYKEFSGKSSLKILKALEKEIVNTLVHICGKTTMAFKKLDYIESYPIKVKEGLNYGQGIKEAIKEKNIKFIGHNCIKNSHLELNNNIIWEIKIK